MSHPRAMLQQAIGVLLSTRTQEQRQAAAVEARRAIDAVLADEPLGDEAASRAEAMARAERGLLEENGLVLRGLSDAALRNFNAALPWAAMTVDEKGRIVGSAWSSQKRAVPHSLIDRRQSRFNEVFPLQGQHVLEVGCFEGIHTLGCILLGATVTAVDGRVENVLKTLARLWAYGATCQALLWNFEESPPASLPEGWDVLHHIGVLYHLWDPAAHLGIMLGRTRRAVILDTHVARNDQTADQQYVVDGRTYRYAVYREKNIDVSPFAGMLSQAKWLHLDDLMALLTSAGFARTELIEDRDERNGRRVLIHAFR